MSGTPKQVHIIGPVTTQVMKHYSGSGLIDQRIKLYGIPGRFIKIIIIKREELGKIIPVHGFRTIDDLIHLIIGIKEVIIMCSGILNETPGKREFFLFRFFRTKLTLFVLFWLWNIKGKTKLRT